MLNRLLHFVFDELSAGSFSQNIGLYTILILLAWIVFSQFKQKSGRFRTN
jgi:hypothetical protein